MADGLAVTVPDGVPLELAVPDTLSVPESDGVRDCEGEPLWDSLGVTDTLPVCDCVGEPLKLAEPDGLGDIVALGLCDSVSEAVWLGDELSDWLGDADWVCEMVGSWLTDCDTLGVDEELGDPDELDEPLGLLVTVWLGDRDCDAVPDADGVDEGLADVD